MSTATPSIQPIQDLRSRSSTWRDVVAPRAAGTGCTSPSTSGSGRIAM